MSLLIPLRINLGLFGIGIPLPVAVLLGVRRNDGILPFKSAACGIPISVVEPIFCIGGRPILSKKENYSIGTKVKN